VGEQDGADFNTAVPSDTVATVLKPVSFLTNDDPSTTGFNDTSIELFLQPSLRDPTTAVDEAAQNSRMRLELHVEDPSGAFTRQRFSLADGQNPAAEFLPVPQLTQNDPVHPPSLTLSLGGSAVVMNLLYEVTLSDLGGGRRWCILVPAGAAPDLDFQVPAITAQVDSGDPVPFEFEGPGEYGASATSYDFGTTPFDPAAYSMSEIELNHEKASRSDPDATITTN
jgi:hypothetical protein